MAISKQKKSEQLQSLVNILQEANGVAFASFYGPTVEEAQLARRSLRKDGMSYTVIKKTLIKLAIEQTKGVTIKLEDFDGPVAVIASSSDEIAPAAAIKRLKKEFQTPEKEPKFEFAGAIFAGAFLDKTETGSLANTPSREESLGKIVGALRFGPKGIHTMLTHGLRGITMSLKEAEKFAKDS